MRKILTAFARIIAAACALLFVVVTPIVLVLFNVGLQLFNPAIYKRAIAEVHLYDRLPALAAEQIYVQIHYSGPALEPGGNPAEDTAGTEADPPPALEDLSQADWEKLLSILLLPGWLQTQTESAIDQVFANLDAAELRPVTISLVEFKARLDGEAGVNAFLELARAQPPCAQAQAQQWAANTASLPECRPPEEMLAAARPQIEAALHEAIAQIPDEVNLAQVLQDSGEDGSGEAPPDKANESPQDPRASLRTVRLGLRLSPLLSAALLLLVALFAVRSVQGIFRWWGAPLLLAGLLGLGMMAAALPVLNWAVATFVAGQAPPYLADSIFQTGLGLARQIVRTLAGWTGMEAAVLGLVGLVMLALSFFVDTRPETQ